jgi:radical SAM superfamily enzyme YgiQ (UPF0313 family)
MPLGPDTKVLLINPPESGQGRATCAPLGLMYIAAVLQEKGIPVRILDACLDGWDAVQRTVADYRPGLVAIACPSYARVQSFRIAEYIKRFDRHILTVLGGHHPTLMGRQILDHYPYVDMVCMGEGEYVMLELCQGRAWQDIRGLGFRRGEEVVINERRADILDLDSLPLPAWNLVEPRRYGTNNNVVVDGVDIGREAGAGISFSRGCVGRCNFCSNYAMWKKWKYRSPGKTLAEIELLYREYGIRCFQFNDDCFSVDKKATLELCREIRARGLRIYFSIVTRTDCIDEEILAALKEAGCYSICFGIETASPRLLKIMHKPIKIEQSLKAIRMVNSFGIRSVALIIAGNVGEDVDSINETIEFLKSADPSDIGVANGLMLFPGTEVYATAKKKGFIDDDFWLTDYNWKVYTAENSRLKLNIFAAAIQSREPLHRFFPLNLFKYHRFLSREIELSVKGALQRAGLMTDRTRRYKPKVSK